MIAQAQADANKAKADLAAVQGNAAAIVGSLDERTIFNSILPVVRQKYRSAVWGSSFYSSGNYVSYSFTWCGFCG